MLLVPAASLAGVLVGGCEGVHDASLHNESGTLFSDGELCLYIAGDYAGGTPLDPKKVSLTSFVAKDDAGKECLWKSEILKESLCGPMLSISVDVREANGNVNARGEITYSGKSFNVVAQWKQHPTRGPGMWLLTSCVIDSR